MQILIAAADESFLESFQAYIWDSGYDAEITTNGLQCRAILDRCRPDVIVIDRELLWGDCDGLLAQLQSDPALSSIPIVVLIGDASEQLGALPNSQVVAWLEKPCQLSDSLHHIQSALGSHRSTTSANSREKLRDLSQ